MSRLPLTPTLALLGWAAMATACFEENPSLPIDETTSTAPGTTGPGPGTTETPDPTTGQPPGTSGGSGLDSSSSGSPPPDCTEPDGNVDAACEATTPYCQGGECMGCDALGPAFCPSLGPRTPVCDLDTGTCSGCTAHDQCGTGACRIQTGECFDGDQRLWVAADRADCAQGDGSQNAPVCTITDALAIVATQPAGETWAVFVASTDDAYQGPIAPSSGHIVALIGEPGVVPVRIDSPQTTTLDLFTGSLELYVDSVTIEHSGSGSQTIRCAFGNQLWLTDVDIVSGPSLTLANCEVVVEDALVIGGNILNGPGMGSLTVRRSFIDQMPGDDFLARADVTLERTELRRQAGGNGIVLDDGQATLRMDQVIAFGSHAETALVVEDGQLDISFSTVIGAVGCVTPGPSAIGDSIIIGLDCDSMAVDNSLVDAGAVQGQGNVLVPPELLGALFVDPTGVTGDYHVLSGSLAQDVGIWNRGDSVIDIDGDPRSGVDRSPDYAGADVP